MCSSAPACQQYNWQETPISLILVPLDDAWKLASLLFALQLIPGATKSGKQKTPEWLKGVLQKLGQLPPDEQGSPTATPSK